MKKSWKMPTAYAILAVLIAAVALATWIIPEIGRAHV